MQKLQRLKGYGYANILTNIFYIYFIDINTFYKLYTKKNMQVLLFSFLLHRLPLAHLECIHNPLYTFKYFRFLSTYVLYSEGFDVSNVFAYASATATLDKWFFLYTQSLFLVSSYFPLRYIAANQYCERSAYFSLCS